MALKYFLVTDNDASGEYIGGHAPGSLDSAPAVGDRLNFTDRGSVLVVSVMENEETGDTEIRVREIESS